MHKISEIISKEIISVFEGEKIGTIKNITFSNTYKKVDAFVFFDDESDFDSVVLAKDIFKATKDGVLIRNLSKISNELIEDNNPVNISVFLLDGTSLGKITDVIFDKNFNVLHFVTSKCKNFLPSQILKMGFDVCLIKEENAKVSISTFKPPVEFAQKSKIIENLQVRLVRLSPAIEEEAHKTLPSLPIKIKPDISTLLGKTATKTITGINNEIIIRQHAIVSKHTLDMAKTHNKTHELMFSISQ